MHGYKVEFPSFPAADIPAECLHWTDISWHNDICPSFEVKGVAVFICPSDPTMREHPDMTRFAILRESETLRESDDWSEILNYINNLKEI